MFDNSFLSCARAETTVAECSLTSCVWARFLIDSLSMPGQRHSQPTPFYVKLKVAECNCGTKSRKGIPIFRECGSNRYASVTDSAKIAYRSSSLKKSADWYRTSILAFNDKTDHWRTKTGVLLLPFEWAVKLPHDEKFTTTISWSNMTFFSFSIVNS